MARKYCWWLTIASCGGFRCTIVALEQTKDLKVGTGTITMDKHHNPIKQAVILENKNGDRVMVAKIMPDAE